MPDTVKIFLPISEHFLAYEFLLDVALERLFGPGVVGFEDVDERLVGESG